MGQMAMLFNIDANVLRLCAVPHSLNLFINHCTLSGIALNRCWAQYFLLDYVDCKKQKNEASWYKNKIRNEKSEKIYPTVY
jgi:hypothetical protein